MVCVDLMKLLMMSEAKLLLKSSTAIPWQSLLANAETQNDQFPAHRMESGVVANWQPQLQRHIDLAFDTYEQLTFAGAGDKKDQQEGTAKEVLAADNEEREYLELGPEKQLNEVRVVLIVD